LTTPSGLDNNTIPEGATQASPLAGISKIDPVISLPVAGGGASNAGDKLFVASSLGSWLYQFCALFRNVANYPFYMGLKIPELY
jgi:hypothetical protein